MGKKSWMIKHQRTITSVSLAEAKNTVERAIERLTVTATRDDKRACVVDYFRTANGPPGT